MGKVDSAGRVDAASSGPVISAVLPFFLPRYGSAGT